MFSGGQHNVEFQWAANDHILTGRWNEILEKSLNYRLDAWLDCLDREKGGESAVSRI
jgi:hypothetical protein